MGPFSLHSSPRFAHSLHAQHQTRCRLSCMHAQPPLQVLPVLCRIESLMNSTQAHRPAPELVHSSKSLSLRCLLTNTRSPCTHIQVLPGPGYILSGAAESRVLRLPHKSECSVSCFAPSCRAAAVDCTCHLYSTSNVGYNTSEPSRGVHCHTPSLHCLAFPQPKSHSQFASCITAALET